MPWSLAEFMDELARRVAEAPLPPHRNACRQVSELGAQLAAEMNLTAVIETGSWLAPQGWIDHAWLRVGNTIIHSRHRTFPATIEIEATPISPNFRDATGAALARGWPMRRGRGVRRREVWGD